MSNPNEEISVGEKGPDKVVVGHNLGMLTKDMVDLLNTESIGGNAGEAEINGKKYRCGAANGFANPETGEIVVFGNIQNIPKDIVIENVEFTLRVAMDWQTGKFIKIVQFWNPSYEKKKFSENGKLAIESAINEWNNAQESLIQ
ncbi:MAG: hypothetical protein A3J46_06560 [Candidatus Yanofskybacteria bacterium RIFCSPHIGHO2_02_FULL_41_11]|uniref:Uncharacterized protein n=1 Tax=Candidatus Yanofskybacteria bacterium RIFCSPHIGHO2_02_FULL_41_11 TaxID=1802675 RepID=A0A1F8F8Y7_9BACT|nr:MAG: hypothetical protein A3J46_06560 [Candidatus Yanofskybacteria bacterium RIFCSPHIGHO2_02_FULL_41_11]